MWDLRRPDLTRTRRLAAKHGHLGANNNIGIRCESFRFFTIFPKWKAGLMEQSQAARRPRLVIPSIGERKYYTELISIVSCCLPSFLHFTLVVIPTHTSKTRASKCEQYLASLIHNPNIQHRNFKLLKLIASHALMTRDLMSTHFCWWSTSSRLVTKTLHLKLNDAFQKRWKEVKSIHETIRDERIYLDQVVSMIIFNFSFYIRYRYRCRL